MKWTVEQMSGLDNPGQPLYGVWLTHSPDQMIQVRVLGQVSLEYLEGFFAGIENSEQYGPMSPEDVRSLRKAIYDGTGVRV